VLAKVRAGLPDKPEQRFGSGRHRLGGRANPPCFSIPRVLGRDLFDRIVDQALRTRLVLDRGGAQVDPQHGAVGNDVVRSAAIDPRRVDRQARSLAAIEP
jgi:hypothetical protein